MARLSKGRGAQEIGIDTYKQIMIAVVHASAVGLGELLKKYRTEAKRTDLIRTYVNKIRFYPDKTGYIFVTACDGLNIALPNPKQWQGKNIYDHRDSHGKYVIRELAEAAKKGGGFVEYYWVKPGFKGEHKKLGYAEPLAGTNAFIGTGVYIED